MRYLVTPMGGSVLATVKAPRVDGPRNPYTDHEVRTMIRVLGASTQRTRARDSAAILTLLGSGLRLNELRELPLPNVHIARPIEESHVLVAAETSKSRSTRKVRLDPMAAEDVHKYIKDWRPDRAPNKSFDPAILDPHTRRLYRCLSRVAVPAAAVGAADSLGVVLGAGGVTAPAGAELSQPPNIATVRSAGHSLRINMPSMMLNERRQSSALRGRNS